MNFTNKTDTVRRTVLKKIKNGNIRHRLENKKTSILFSFNPHTKIGILSAEISPTLREIKDYAVYGEPPALPIDESLIITALQQVLQTCNTPDVTFNDRLIVFVTNEYLKTIDQPYSFIDSKRIRRIVETYLKNTVVPQDDCTQDGVKGIIERFERKIQEVANQLPNMKTELHTKIQGVEDEAKALIQQQVEDVAIKIQAVVENEAKLNNLLENLRKELHSHVLQQIQGVASGEAKVQDLLENLKKEIYEKVKQYVQDILHVMDEEKVKSIVENLRTDLCNTIQELSKQRDAVFMEACIENYWSKQLTETNEVFETIIERVVKRYVEKDHSIPDSCDDHTLHYDELYGNPEISENKNPIIDHIMNGNKKASLEKEEEDIYMDDVYQKQNEPFNIVHHVNELRSSADKKWVPFGKGVGNTVMDMYVDPETKKIYITGLFEQVDNIAANNLASYDITRKKWEHVGNGINNLGVCLAMDLENQILYIGGIFNSVDQEPNTREANNIVSYNLFKNEWETLGDGFNAECACLCFDNEHKILYAGGAFTQIGNESISYVAFYDRVQNKWFPLSDEILNGPCRTMCINTESRELFLGGVFTEIGEYMYYYVASFDTRSKEWTELCGGLQGNCNCLCLNSDAKVLYVGGTFDSVGSEENRIESRHIASYHLENHEWSPLAQGLDGVCHTMIYNTEQKCLIIGGAFTHVVGSNVVVNHIVKYDTVEEKWLPFDNFFDVKNAQNKDNIGLDGNCNSLCMDENAYYMCGTFKKAGTVHANSIVKYLQYKVK